MDGTILPRKSEQSVYPQPLASRPPSLHACLTTYKPLSAPLLTYCAHFSKQTPVDLQTFISSPAYLFYTLLPELDRFIHKPLSALCLHFPSSTPFSQLDILTQTSIVLQTFFSSPVYLLYTLLSKLDRLAMVVTCLASVSHAAPVFAYHRLSITVSVRSWNSLLTEFSLIGRITVSSPP